MAATNFNVAATSVALVAGTPKSVLSLIAAANINLILKSLSIGFNGVSGTEEPALVELVRFASDGTGTSVTPIVTDLSGATVQATSKHTYTVEPTTATILGQWKIHTQSSLILPFYGNVILPKASVTCLRVTKLTNNGNCWAVLHAEE